MNRKTKYILSAIVGCVIVLTAIYFAVMQFTQEENITMKLAIFPTGTAEETYYFVLTDKVLTCSVGTRRNDNIKTNRFLRGVSNTCEMELSAQELQSLIDIAEELQLSGYDTPKKIFLDSWDVSLLYNGKVYDVNYWNNESEAFRILVDEIIRLSPIPVDLHGWA